MSASINIIGDGTNASTSEYVETATNVTGQLTPIAHISPDRGMYLRIANRVSKGDQIGLPIYAKFNDSTGATLPSNTTIALAIKPLGEEQWLLVSDKQDNISYWNTNSLTTQRDEENVDAVKLPLKYPTGVQKEGRPDAVNVNGVDEMYVLAKSSAQISWPDSEFYVESEAVSKGRNR